MEDERRLGGGDLPRLRVHDGLHRRMDRQHPTDHPARLHREPGRRLGARLGLVGQVPEEPRPRARRLLQPLVGHPVGGHEPVGDRRRPTRHQGGRHRQPGRLLRRGRAPAVGGHDPRRSRGIREGLRRLLPRTRRRVPPDRLSGLVRERVRPERGHGRAWPTAETRISRRSSGCGRRPATCS